MMNNNKSGRKTKIVREYVQKLSLPAEKADATGKLNAMLKSSDPESKLIAITVAAEMKLTETVPELFKLISDPQANAIDDKQLDPGGALIMIGKKGLPRLLDSIREAPHDSIPYQIVANVLYCWFNKDKNELEKFLKSEEEKADQSSKIKFQSLLKTAANWKF